MDKSNAIIVDLEGTISNCQHRHHHYLKRDYNSWNNLFKNDKPNKGVIQYIIDNKKNHKIIICTAKSIKYADEVSAWLNKHFPLPSDCEAIIMRKKDDNRSSVEVKRDMLYNIQKEYYISLAIDDRQDILDMFLNNDIPVLNARELYSYAKTNIIEDIQPLNVPYLLHHAADLFKSRNPEYGNSYKNFGPIMKAYFPDGITLDTIDDFNRFGVFTQMISKSNRYANNFSGEGHPDSLKDLSVYSAMLLDLDLNKEE